MPASVHNRVSEIRRGRDISAADLAQNVGVSRQTIYAIEAGTYVPNTEVSLRLARELEVSVEDLFSLAEEKDQAPHIVQSEVLSMTPSERGQPVRVCRTGTRLISVPVSASPYFLPEADGVIASPSRAAGKAGVAVFTPDEGLTKRLVLAGCDPAIGLLSRMTERFGGVEIVSAAASSRLALQWLKAGKVHIAGTHLKDEETGEFNIPIVRREFADGDFAVVTFAHWEEGFVTAKGNPKQIKTVADLARRAVRFINREPGSGSRGLLDNLLVRAGIESSCVKGYERIARGHLAAAYAVRSGEVDCCIATRSAARTFGLEFHALDGERYDFVLRRKSLDSPAVQNFLDVLQRAALRRKLEAIAGYDTAQTGVVLS